MTDTITPPPSPQTSTPPRPPLRRIDDGKVIGGVAGGVARWLDVDPVLVRVIAVVLAVFGGSGLVLYLLGWLFLPSDSVAESPAQSVLGRNRVLLVLAGAVVTFIALGILGPFLVSHRFMSAGPLGLFLLVALVIAVVYLRRDRTPNPTAPADPVPAEVPVVASPVTAPPATKQRKPRRERSPLGWMTLSAMLLVVGVLMALRFSGAVHLSAVVIVAAALGVVGCGLVVGAFVGRARGLIVMGLLLVLALIPTTVINNLHMPLQRNANVTLTPRTVDALPPSYSLGAGQVTLDLTRVHNDSQQHVTVIKVGLGAVRVYLPRNLVAVVTAQANVGNIRAPWSPHDLTGASIEKTFTQGTATPQRQPVHIDLQVGAGQVEVVRS